MAQYSSMAERRPWFGMSIPDGSRWLVMGDVLWLVSQRVIAVRSSARAELAY